MTSSSTSSNLGTSSSTSTSLEEMKDDRKELKTDQGGLLWKQLRKFVNLVDELRDLGLQEHINLPRIAVLGTQSSGKSSVLESIIGLDFLPRGDVHNPQSIEQGVVTRRPLELRLHHLQENIEPWAVFEEVKEKKFTSFQEVRNIIEELTDKFAGTKKGIVDVPIVLSIHSSTCPDLTLIDLPGITRIPLKDSDQPANIEQITTDMAKRYCIDERTIILCVVPANIDLSTSEALKYAQEWDKHQVRTLGVLTKLDIMDSGTNAKRVLLNQEIHLKLGYVGVRNRSQQDIVDKMNVQHGLEIESEWFVNHPVYRTLPKDCYGADTLTHKLSRLMYVHIRNSLPDIIKEVSEKLQTISERIKDLGAPLPSTDAELTQVLWNMLTNFVNLFKNEISGRLNLKTMQRGKEAFEISGGAKIKTEFYELYKEYSGSDFNVSTGLTDKEIEYAIILHEGDNISGFPSVEMFYYLLRPEIEKLKEPALKCLADVHYYLEEMALAIMQKVFARFPSVTGELMAVVRQIMSEERDKTKYIVESLIDAEIGYIFTNDIDYNGKRTDVVPGLDNPDRNTEPNMIYVKEIRARIDAYYKLIIRNVRDSIPKVIGCFLVKAVQTKLQLELAMRLTKNEQAKALLSEPPSAAEERKRLFETETILKKALKVMQRDPDLNVSSSRSDEELVSMLAELKVECVQGKIWQRKSKKKMQEKNEKTTMSVFGADTVPKLGRKSNLFSDNVE